MFVQIIQGRTEDRAGIRRLLDRWAEQLLPGADGFLGSTAGVSDDGELVIVARFESEEAARRNSARPEQGVWWEEVSKHLTGPARFDDCADVELWLGGGSDDAGFVQVIRTRPTDAQALRALNAESTGADEQMAELRPDVIGGLRAWHGDGGYTEVVYFTSEREARAGEAKPLPPDVRAQYDRWLELAGDLRYVDLREPWMLSR